MTTEEERDAARTDDDETEVVVVVEIPAGSRNKYEVDEESGEIFLDRVMFTASRFPADYGFVRGATGEDGEPLDALVIVSEPTFPGCRVRARPVGVFTIEHGGGLESKVIAVPERDPLWSHVRDVGELPEAVRGEIEQFFDVYKDLEPDGGDVRPKGFSGRGEAVRVLQSARDRAAER